MRQGRQLLVGPTSVVDDARERHWEPATSRLISGCACITTVQHVASRSHRCCAHSRKPMPVLRCRCAQRTWRSAMDACSACNIVGTKLTGCHDVLASTTVFQCSVWNCAIRDSFHVNSQQSVVSAKQQCQQNGPQHQQQLRKIGTTNNVWLLPLCCAGLVALSSLMNTLRRLQHALLLDASICRLA